MPNWEFGVRCSEDVDGNLWVGHVGVTKFKSAFPHLEDKVKRKLKEVRRKRRGAFWINFEENVLYVVTETSIDTGEYPKIGLG